LPTPCGQLDLTRGNYMSGSQRAARSEARHLAILILCSAVAGLSTSAAADTIPTGAAGPSYIAPGMTKFSQPMPRFDLQPRKSLTQLHGPAPTLEANTT